MLKYYKMYSDVVDPKYQTSGSVCFDIHAYITTPPVVFDHYGYGQKVTIGNTVLIDNKLSLHPGHRYLIPTGLKFEIPQGYHLKLYIRSSLALKKGLILGNSVGIIDTDYRNELCVILYNPTKSDVIIKHQERIAQVELCQNCKLELREVFDDINLIGDRKGGFGSTGI